MLLRRLEFETLRSPRNQERRTMTHEQQNDFLATEAMDWHLIDLDGWTPVYQDIPTVTGVWWADKENKLIILYKDWNPTSNFEQAMMVAKQLRIKHSLWLTLHQVPSKTAEWHAYFTFGGMAVGNRMRGEAYSSKDEPAQAICAAAIKAKGGEYVF